MRFIALVFYVLIFMGGCSKENNLVQIRYTATPTQSYSIGQERSGLNFDALTDELRKYHQKYPNARFEFFSEYKLVPTVEKGIRSAISGAGIKLEHFWVPVSNIDPKERPGPYGAGIVDLNDVQ